MDFKSGIASSGFALLAMTDKRIGHHGDEEKVVPRNDGECFGPPHNDEDSSHRGDEERVGNRNDDSTRHCEEAMVCSSADEAIPLLKGLLRAADFGGRALAMTEGANVLDNNIQSGILESRVLNKMLSSRLNL